MNENEEPDFDAQVKEERLRQHDAMVDRYTLRRVSIEITKHEDQRYNTVGDWFFEDRGCYLHPLTADKDCRICKLCSIAKKNSLVIRISDTGNWRWNMALALHEFAEAVLCTAAGVSQEAVDSFDFNWKPSSKKPEIEEPGDDALAPYHKQHIAATQLELEFFDEFYPQHDAKDRMVSWDSYEEKLDELMKGYRK